MIDIKSLSDGEIINLYREIIKTKNALGELGEYLAM